MLATREPVDGTGNTLGLRACLQSHLRTGHSYTWR